MLRSVEFADAGLYGWESELYTYSFAR